jgi:hypothetical protein
MEVLRTPSLAMANINSTRIAAAETAITPQNLCCNEFTTTGQKHSHYE